MFPFRVFRRRTTLAPHEVVEFYPSYGYRDETQAAWRLVVQGCAYNPKLPWIRRRPVMAVIKRAMRVDRAADAYFRQRMQRFLLDTEVGRQIAVQMDGQVFPGGTSDPAGLFRQEIVVPEEIVARMLLDPTPPGDWVTYSAALSPNDPRQFVGRIQLIEPQGVSIVSDVDDTIKHSNVPNRRDLFHNTFAREFSPIPDMAPMYQTCADMGAVFHFVSGSPWQLFEPLAEFFRKHGFPFGSFHLKPFRIRDTARKMRGPSPQLAHKRAALEPILKAFPQRKFILIGDSGEQDALIYGGFLREQPDQILGVFIRAVRGETGDDPRMKTAFEGCPAGRWHIYQTPATIRDELLKMVASPSAV